MRRTIALLLAVPAVGGVLYACTGDDPSNAPTADAGPTPTTTTTTTTPPPPPPPPPPPTDSGSDAPPAYTPADLGTKLVLWLEADRGYTPDAGDDAGAVWKDNSTYGNNASTIASRVPTYLDAGADGGLATRGVLHFSGTEYLEIADNASLQWGSSDFGIYMVMRHTNAGYNYGIGYGKWTEAYPFAGPFIWANYVSTKPVGAYVVRLDSNHDVGSDGGYNDGQLRIVAMRRTGGKIELRINGVSIGENADAGEVDAGAADGVGHSAFIGGRTNLSQQLLGDIAEIVGAKGTVSDAEQSKLESYLKSKYGL